jgi:hypothetical protein
MSSLLWAAAAAAAFSPPVTAEQLIENARARYAIEKPRHEICPRAREDEIVVCREIGDPEQYRVPSAADSGVIRDHIPRAPDLEPKYAGVPVATGCFIPPCPRPMPKMIDLSAIPEAPAGSDADRIGRGELGGP